VENRKDLADILFAGLPAGEADHVRNVIRQTDADLLARKRAQDVSEQPVDLITDEFEDESDEEALVS
jgi:hypothetical protein